MPHWKGEPAGELEWWETIDAQIACCEQACDDDDQGRGPSVPHRPPQANGAADSRPRPGSEQARPGLWVHYTQRVVCADGKKPTEYSPEVEFRANKVWFLVKIVAAEGKNDPLPVAYLVQRLYTKSSNRDPRDWSLETDAFRKQVDRNRQVIHNLVQEAKGVLKPIGWTIRHNHRRHKHHEGYELVWVSYPQVSEGNTSAERSK